MHAEDGEDVAELGSTRFVSRFGAEIALPVSYNHGGRSLACLFTRHLGSFLGDV
jgi:hypothetical protein